VPGAFERMLVTLEHASRVNRLLVTARLLLTRDNAADAGTWVESIRDRSDRAEIVRLSMVTRDAEMVRTHGVPRSMGARAIQAAWEAARVVHLRLSAEGFTSFPSLPIPRDVATQPVDHTSLEFLLGNVPLPSVSGGTWATPKAGDVSGVWFASEAAGGLQNLGLAMSALGAPPLDLTPDMGGCSLTFKPEEREAAEAEDRVKPFRRRGVPALLWNTLDDPTRDERTVCEKMNGRVAVVVGGSSEGLLATSSMKALHHALTELGATSTLHSVWEAPFNPYAVPAEGTDPLAITPARSRHATRQTDAFLASLDLSGVDDVIVLGFETAWKVFRHPSLDPSARLHVIDPTLLSGIGSFRNALPSDPEEGWWPHERLRVHSFHPRYVRAFLRAQVPLRHVAWHPFPLDTEAFSSEGKVAGGGGIVVPAYEGCDFETLAKLASQFPQLSDIQVLSHEAPPPLQAAGRIGPTEQFAQLCAADVILLPFPTDPRRPLGVEAIAMALASGRPIIASASPTTVAHLSHGHNAILVPPGRPKSFAKAIAKVQGSPALAAKLAEGAKASAPLRSVKAFAKQLLQGAPEATCFHHQDEARGPWYPWPV